MKSYGRFLRSNKPTTIITIIIAAVEAMAPAKVAIIAYFPVKVGCHV